MAIWQVITFEVQAGQGGAFIDGFRPIVEQVRQSDGCERYELLISADSPDTLVMVERWRDEAALNAALGQHKPSADDPALSFLKLLVGAPRRERFEVG